MEVCGVGGGMGSSQLGGIGGGMGPSQLGGIGGGMGPGQLGGLGGGMGCGSLGGIGGGMNPGSLGGIGGGISPGLSGPGMGAGGPVSGSGIGGGLGTPGGMGPSSFGGNMMKRQIGSPYQGIPQTTTTASTVSNVPPSYSNCHGQGAYYDFADYLLPGYSTFSNFYYVNNANSNQKMLKNNDQYNKANNQIKANNNAGNTYVKRGNPTNGQDNYNYYNRYANDNMKNNNQFNKHNNQFNNNNNHYNLLYATNWNAVTPAKHGYGTYTVPYSSCGRYGYGYPY